MKKILYTLGVIAILFSSCNSEDDLTPSNLDKDWYSITDEGNTAVDKQIYDIFQSTNYAIFTNDTIGKELRWTNSNNEQVWYYEVLNYNYFIEEVDYLAVFDYLTDDEKATLLDFLTFFKSDVIDYLPSGITRSFFLVKNLNYKKSNDNDLFPIDTYIGLSTTIIGGVLDYSSMTDDEKVSYKNSLVSNILANYLVLNDTEGYFNDFFDYSSNLNDPAPYDVLVSQYSGLEYKDIEDYGFINAQLGRDVTSNSYYTPTKLQDITDYLSMYIDNDKEVYSKYSRESVIIAKFTLLKTALQNFNDNIVNLKITE